MRFREGGRARPRRIALVIGALAGALGVLVWAGLAGGTQPDDTYQATITADGPVAQFRLADSVGSSSLLDSAGAFTASNTGVVLGGAGPFAGSKSGSFGGEAYATLPSSPVTTSAFTAEAWVDWTGGASYKQPIFDFGSSATNYMYLTPASALSLHRMLFEIHATAGGVLQLSASKLKSGAWEYVAVTETSAGVATLYLDGAQVAQITGATLSPASLGAAATAYLGKSLVPGDPGFNGALSNVAFYNAPLSAAQIKAHYNAGEFPVNTVAPTISGTPKDGKTLAAKAGTWTGLAPITFMYQWNRCNVAGAECVALGPPTAESKYPLTPADIGSTMRVAVNAENPAGSASATTAQTAVVEAVKPGNTGVPVISGSARVGQLLSVSNGSWEGGSPPTEFKYQWQSCPASGVGCSNISGATTATHRIMSAELGRVIRAIVTAVNSGGSASSTSAITATVVAGEPVNTAAPSISGTARDGEELTAGKGSWAGTEPIEYSYQWRRCNVAGESCADISGATGTKYALTAASVGATLVVVVKAKNSVGTISAASPASAVVKAIQPANVTPPTLSGTARDGQTLTATSGSWSGSAPLEYAYQWQGCSAAGESCANISGATSSAYTLGHSDVGRRLRVVVRASNSAGSASSESTPSAAVAALAPSNTSSPTVTGTARDGQTLSAEPGSWVGTPPLEYAYQWQGCSAAGESCANISGATGSSYVVVAADVGTKIRVVVTTTNAAGSSSASSAASAVVSASAPANEVPPTITGTAQVGQTLSVSTGSWAGTPTITYAYQWKSCNAFGEACMSIAGATASTYVLAPSDASNTIRVAVLASNFAGSAESVSDATGAVAPGTPSGFIYLSQFGSEGTGPGEFNHPGGIAIAPGGDVWVLDVTNNSAQEFTPSGEYVRQLGGVGSEAGQLSGPDAIAVDASGNVWIADTGNRRVEEFSPTGEFLRTVGLEGAGEFPGSIEGIGVAPNGDVWVSATAAGQLFVFSAEGEYLKTVASKGSEPGEIGEPEHLAFDSTGDVWVADWSNNRVEEFSAAGEYLQEFGAEGSEEGQVSLPYAVAVDSADNVWVGEVGNDRVQEFDSSGGYLAQLGPPEVAVGPFGFSYPIGLAFDQSGDLWVTDPENRRVEQWGPGSISPPANTAPPTISGALEVGETIHVSPGTWSGVPAPSFHYQWLRCNGAGEECSAVSGATHSDYELGSEDLGSTLRVLVTATNIAGSASEYSSPSALVQTAQPPRNTVLPAIEGSPQDGQTLTASTGSWEGKAPLSYSYQWQTCSSAGLECKDKEGATEAAYPLSSADVGKRIRVVVMATDAAGSTHAISATTETIAARAPAELKAPTIAGIARDGQTLTAGTGTWSGTTPLSIAYQWQSCDGAGAECTDISGATGSTYTVGHADVGGTLDVLVTATNAAGSASATAAVTAVVAAAAPLDTVRPVISGHAEPGETLTVTTGSWAGTPPFSYSYQWERCDVAGEECKAILGAETNSYIVGLEDAGRALRALVTATNAVGSSVAAVSVGGAALVNTGQPTILGEARVGSTLTALNGAWSGIVPIEYAYQWQRCAPSGEGCADISGASSIEYTPVAADAGKKVKLVVTAFNLEGSASTSSSPSPIIAEEELANALPPTIAGVPEPGQTLTADPGMWSGPGSLTYAYAWERCNAEGEECAVIAGATSASYTLTGTDVGAMLQVLVSASDGASSVQALSAPTSPIGESRPVNTAAPSVEGVPNSGQVLHANPGTWTGLGLRFSYVWELCNGVGAACTPIHGATGDEYELSYVLINSTIRVIVAAANELGSGTALSATTPPIRPELSLIDTKPPSIVGAAQVGSALQADIGTWSGLGSLTYIYQWRACEEPEASCHEIPGAVGSTYTPTLADIGSYLRVAVTANDERGPVQALSPATAAVVGEEDPALITLPAISGVAEEGQTLSSDAGSWLSPTEATYTYQWERCDEAGSNCASQPGATASTYVLSKADVGSTLRVKVIATNAHSSSSATSPPSSPIVSTLENISLPQVEAVSGGEPGYDALPGVWSSSGPASFGYQWQRCDASGHGCQDIPGAKSARYALISADASGVSLRVNVTATNTPKSVTVASAPSVVHAPSLPWITGATRVGAPLSAQLSASLQEAGPAYSYQWRRCDEMGSGCIDIAGASEAAYTIQEADLGASLVVAVTAAGQSEPTVSEPVWIGAPTRPSGSVTIEHEAGTLTDGSKLTVAPGGVRGSEPIASVYQWERCNASGAECAAITGAGGASYSVSAEDIGATLRATVTYTNSYGSDTEHSEASSVIAGSAPRASSPPVLTWQGALEPGTSVSASSGGWVGDTPITFEYQWELCDSTGSECSVISGASGAEYTIEEAALNDTLRITVTATNELGTSSQSAGGSGYVVLAPSGAPSAVVRPSISGTLRGGETLTADRGTWINAPTGTTYSYQWLRCASLRPGLEGESEGFLEGRRCIEIGGATGQTYTLKEEDTEEVVAVRVSAENPEHLTAAATSLQSSTVAGGPAVNRRAPTITGTVVVGNTLKATVGKWSNSSYTSLATYQWRQCDSSGGSCVALPGATGTGFKPDASVIGDRLSVAVTVPGPGGSATAFSTPSIAVVAAVAPTVGSQPSLTGSATAGGTLTLSHGSWAGSPEISYAYSWSRCDSSGSSCTPIVATTGTTYHPTLADIGHTLIGSVLASNGGGSASANTPHTAVVPNPSAPVSITAPALSLFGVPSYGQPLMVQAGTWSGGPELAEQWQRCDPMENDPKTGEPRCQDINAATGVVYTPGAADIGYYLRVTETATNPSGVASEVTHMSAEAVTPEAVTDEGGAYSGALVVGHTITAQSPVSSSPALPTSTEYTFARKAPDGSITPEQVGANAHYTLSSGDVGDEIQITMQSTITAPGNHAVVYESTDTVTTAAVKAVLTDRAIPTISGAFAENAVLTAGNGIWASGSAAMSFTYQWQRCDSSGQNCVAVFEANSETFSLSSADVESTIRVAVTADDGGAVGTEVSEPTPIIGVATPPINEEPPSISGSAQEGFVLTAAPGQWSGVGILSFTYQWKVCYDPSLPCSSIAGAEQSEYTPTGSDVGATLQVEVTALDGTSETVAASPATETVAAAAVPVNTANPTVTVIGPATSEVILAASGGEWEHLDPGAAAALAYQWERCDSATGCSAIGGANAAVYDATAADAGHSLRVEVTAANGSGEDSVRSLMTPTLIGSKGSAQNALVYVEGENVVLANRNGEQARSILSCSSLTAAVGEEHCSFRHPSISPSGQMIAVEVRPQSEAPTCPAGEICPESDNSAKAHVVLVNYDGSGERVLPMQGGQPTWAPEGTSLLIVHTTESLGGALVSQLQTIDMRDTQTATAFPAPANIDSAQSPSYSLGGGQLAYVARDATTGKWAIYVAGGDGAAPTELEFEGLTNLDEPIFVPGTAGGATAEIMFTATDPSVPASGEFGASRPRRVYTGTLDGTEATPIVPETGDYSSPRMNTNSAEVVATRHDPKSGEAGLKSSIWQTNVQAGTGHALTTSGREPSETSPPAPSSLYAPEEVPPGSSPSPTAHAAASSYDALAREFEPTLYVDRSDGFLPISESWMLKLGQVGSKGFHRSLRCGSHGCHKVGPESALSPYTGNGEKIQYPAVSQPAAQELQTINSIYEWTVTGFNSYGKAQQEGTDNLHPDAQLGQRHVYYAIVHRHGMLTIDYWYYYTYNYFNGLGENCQAPHPGEGFPCTGFLHDLHEGDWENIQVVLNHPNASASGTPFKATEYILSQHDKHVLLPASNATVINKHVQVASAHGDHANYPICKKHSGKFEEEIFFLHGIKGTSRFAAYDHICTEHNYRRGRRPELGEFTVGGGSLVPENLTSAPDKERFSCWKGRFGDQQGTGIFGIAYGTSPAAPLQQLDGNIDEAGQECVRQQAS